MEARTEARVTALRAIGSSEAALLADLLNYHRREAKPEWWAYFERQKKSLDDLADDNDAIALLSPASDEQATPDKKSMIVPLDFPEQEYKLKAPAQVEDPFRAAAAGEMVRLDGQRRRLHLRRGPSVSGIPLPNAIVKGKPLDDRTQRDALGRLADEIISGGRRYRAVRDLIARAYPRVRGRHAGQSIQTIDLDAQKALVAALDESYLFFQGPPGSGKTWTGARLIVSLITAGKRVGVASLSHKAINNLLEEVSRVARVEGLFFSGLKKNSDKDDEFDSEFIVNTTENKDCESSGAQLIAGTSWLFARPAMHGRIDYLFIDEAGQLSLADTVAMGTAATNVVLLGDPQQLPQIQEGVHPGDAGRSALEHLLGDNATVAEDRGVFQERTFRMHPDVCAFISNLAYDSRLRSAEGCERQAVVSTGLSGAGIRFIPVGHEGNAQASREEADTIQGEVDRLLAGGTFVDAAGNSRLLTPADILVVAPYNMQVRLLRELLPAGVEAGTVDKFQGREAPVVFFSMASSSGQVISHLARLAEAGEIGPSLIVCPKTIIENWKRELDRFLPGEDVFVYDGTPLAADALRRKNLVITSYDTLRARQLELAKVDWRCVVCDEAQYAKNPTAQRTSAVKALKSHHRIALTGTPVENGLIEFWCILDFVRPGHLASWSEFRDTFERPLVNVPDEEARRPLVNKLLDALHPHYLRRMKDEILTDLPHKAEREIAVPLGELQFNRYREVAAGAKQGSRGEKLAGITRLLMVCAHPLAVDEEPTVLRYVPGDCPKLDATLDLLAEIRSRGEKVLVFTRFLAVQRILQEAILSQFDIWPATINGALTRNLQQTVDHFQRQPGFNVLILSHDVGGIGLNITGANHVVHYTRPWNPAKENQATDRVHRIGQTRPVTVYHPIATDERFVTVERRLAQLLAMKQSLARDVLRPTKELAASAHEMLECLNVPARRAGGVTTAIG